jgi:hypothetical protein
MKGFKGTIFFSLVVIVIGGLAFVEFRKSLKDEETKAEKGHLFRGLGPEDLVEFSAKGSSVFKFKREGSEWILTEPFLDDADGAEVESAIRSILTYNVEPLDFEGASPMLEKYGLDKPLSEYSFVGQKGEVYSLAVGQTRSFDRGYYVVRADVPGVQVGDSGLESIVGKTLDQFRNKRVLLGDGGPQKIQIQSRLKGRAETFSLSTKDGAWVHEQKPNLKLDDGLVRDFISTLRQFRAEGFWPESEKGPFTNPQLRIQLTMASGQVVDIQIDNAKTPGSTLSLWASTSKSQSRLVIQKSKVEEFAKTTGDFRNKSVPFEFNVADIESFERFQRKDGKTIRYLKKGEDWLIEGKAQEKASATEVSSFLTGLSGLKALAFDVAGAPSPKDGEVTLKGKDGRVVMKLSYGAPTRTAKGEDVYVLKSQLEPKPLYVAKASVDDLMFKKLVEPVPVEHPKDQGAQNDKHPSGEAKLDSEDSHNH